MRVCILTDYTLPSFVRVGELYEATFKKMGWQVSHISFHEKDSQALRSFDILFHNVNGRNFIPVQGSKNIAFFVHEWSHYPPQWAPYLDDFDALWATTEHCQQIASRSGLKPPVYWIPPAIDLGEFPTKTDYTPHTPFRFIYVGDWHFRKGLHLLFEAWDLAFPELNTAQLTIKTSADCPIEAHRKDIQIIKDHWSRERIYQAYLNSDCYVTASLGEGWGLPVLEAICCGLPVCANLWGGHGSMLTEDTCYAIEHEEAPQLYASKPELYAPRQICGYSSPSSIAAALEKSKESATPKIAHNNLDKFKIKKIEQAIYTSI